MKKNWAILLTVAVLISSITAMASELPREVVVIATQISLRKAPQISAKRLDGIKNGTVVEVMCETEDGNWYMVETTDGKCGYVQNQYVVEYDYIVFREGTHVYATPYSDKRVGGDRSAGEKYTLIGEWDDYYVINYKGGSGFVSKNDPVWTKDFIEEVKSYNNFSVIVTSDATLYSGPSNKWAKLGSVKKGQSVTVIAQEDGYYVIEYEDIIAYIPQNCVTFA